MVRKKIDKNLEVTVTSLVRNGTFHYSNKTETVIIDLEEFGDDDFIDFASLKQMMARSKSILEDFNLLITGVEDDEITIEDVVSDLKLSDGYKELASFAGSKINSLEFDQVSEKLLNCKPEDLEKILTSKKSKIKNLLIKEAVHLQRIGELNDFNKMNAIGAAAGYVGEEVSSFWSDLAASK